MVPEEGRIADECYGTSFRLSQLGAKLKQQCFEIDVLNDPQHIERIQALITRLGTLDKEFCELGDYLES